ncbi:MAG: Wzz/FepE/Etk N-terminal domain-containing protein [Aquificaceae bacterium]|nr:Wzz/FepE/Etk N-terminal domain-containing protein [Aquificaceae bacterium]MDW8096937.1 Wzz/FepE/Etk N-terminal domain-containing protein [Aquificaceae bacterium]
MGDKFPEKGQERAVDYEEIDLLELLLILWKSRRLILLLTLTSALLAFLLAVIVPKTYTSKSALAPVPRGLSDSAILLSIYANAPVTIDLESSELDIKRTLKSYELSMRVIRELGLERELRTRSRQSPEEILERFRDRVKIVHREGVLFISVEWNDPDKAKRINESILKNLNLLLNEKKTERISYYTSIYEKKLEEIGKELAEKTGRLNRLLDKKTVSAGHPNVSLEGLYLPPGLGGEKLVEYVDTYLQIVDLMEKQRRLSLLLEKMRMMTAKEIKQVEIIQPASYPTKPSRPQIPLMVTAGLVAGFVFSVFVSLLKHSLKSKRR